MFTVTRAVPFNFQFSSNHTPFCDKNYKPLSVVTEASTRIFFSCLCKIGDFQTRRLQKQLAIFLIKSWGRALTELPDGAFMVSLHSHVKENKSEHTFGLVKSSERYFLFDPGHAILLLNVQEATRVLIITITSYKANAHA